MYNKLTFFKFHNFVILKLFFTFIPQKLAKFKKKSNFLDKCNASQNFLTKITMNEFIVLKLLNP